MKHINSLLVCGRVNEFRHLIIADKSVVIFFLLLLFFLVSCSRVPLAVYDFDDGTTQGWKVSGTFDDKGSVYTPIFPASHFEAAQYPNSFPNGDPLNDKKGCLLINGGQMGYWAQTSGFPSNSEYWELTAYYTGLSAHKSTTWQGIKGVKASVGDNFGAAPGHMSANIKVRARIGGKEEVITELDASGNPLFHPVSHQLTGKWSHLSTNLNIPANSEVYQVMITIRGDWKTFALYEGAIMIDQVEPIK